VIKQTNADSGFFQYSYALDSNGNVTQTTVTDPRGLVEQVSFNADGYETSDTKAVGKPEQQTVTFNRQQGSGLLLSITDALSRQTAFTYDQLGNLTSQTRLAGSANAVTSYFGYEPQFNQITTSTDPLGHTTTFTYDNVGNLIAVTDPLGNTTSMVHNAKGQVTSATDPLGNTTQFTYNSYSDLVAITDPLGGNTSRFYDAVGRLISVTDPIGQTTKTDYDNLNEPVTLTDAKGSQTVLGYDANGNLTSVNDANNHVTQYTLDSMDRVSTRKDALLNQDSYQYDLNGNLSQFTDRRGKVTAFTYDGLNRLTFEGFGASSGPTYESTVNYTYDAGNRPTQAVDSVAGTITRSYTQLDQLTSDVTPQGTVGYTYDAAGRRATLTVPGQAVANYSFDPANRMTQITQGTSTVSFTYDSGGRRTSTTLPNGVLITRTYDIASQLTTVAFTNAGGSLGTLAYAYDQAGQRTGVSGSYASTGLPLAVSATGYNANNQLTKWGTANLFYDANGNMTSDGTHSYSWDARNHLNQIDLGTTASFSYDAFGRRTNKIISGAQTGFLYDGANAVQELSSGTVTANSLMGGIDEVFQRTDSAGTRNFLTDALGSTLALTDASGVVQTSYSFDPFGNTLVGGSSSANSFAYAGRERDSNLLYFYRARYYSAVLQRFISEDPSDFAGGDVNLYAYVHNNPLNWIDVFGLTEGSPANLARRASIGQIAQSYGPTPESPYGSQAWNYGADLKFAVSSEIMEV
jgi:RHS repeat-associated protein